MKKAEQRALEAYPPKFTEQKRYSKRVQSEKTDTHSSARAIYLRGYHQAEKDLELGWEDIKEICVQSVLVEVDLGGLVSDERHYTEVLKRFKERKKK